MQDRMNDWLHTLDRSLSKRVPKRASWQQLLFLRSGVALLIAMTVAVLISPLANNHKTQAYSRLEQGTTGQVTPTKAPSKNTTGGFASFELAYTHKLTLVNFGVINAPPNITLEMDVLGKSCMGKPIFTKKVQSDTQGIVYIDQDPPSVPLIQIPRNWWVNVYDTTRRDPANNKKFLSLACGPIDSLGKAVFPRAALPNNYSPFAYDYVAQNYIASICDKEKIMTPECRPECYVEGWSVNICGGSSNQPDPSIGPAIGSIEQNTGSIVTTEGTIQRTGITTYMYGAYQLADRSGKTIYALRSSKLDLNQYVGRTVKITGSLVPGYPVDGGPPYLDVTGAENPS